MMYIYDLLLNFQDKERLVEFFEWSKQDVLEHVKKIPIVRVPSIDMDNFCFADIVFDFGYPVLRFLLKSLSSGFPIALEWILIIFSGSPLRKLWIPQKEV